MSGDTRPSPAPARVSPILAEATWELRGSVLRPLRRGQPVRLRGDEVPEALHVGAFVAGELLGIASVLPERPALLPPAAGVAMHPLPGDWRLRGMAVRVDARRHGLGRALLEAAVAHAIAKGGTALWCHARIAAQPFYTALGMRTEGAPFDVPEIGPHVFMWMPL